MYNIKSLTPQKALSETNNKELFGIVFKDFSQSLYDDYKDAMGDLADITKEELMAYGIKEQESQRLLALAELMKRSQLEKKKPKTCILSSQQLAKYIQANYEDEKQENLILLCLDTQNNIISEEVIFKGGTQYSIATPKEITYQAIKKLSTSIILAHNHPSGSYHPSQNDVNFTRKMTEVCELLEIDLLDHIIVGREGYYSFREETDIIQQQQKSPRNGAFSCIVMYIKLDKIIKQ